MPTIRPARAATTAVLVAVLTLILAACTGTGTDPSTTPTSAPPASPTAVTLDALLGSPQDHDGQVVTVTGTLIAAGAAAEMCDIVMESYPPQCGPSIRLVGTVPEGVADRLEQTTEPDLAQAMWGLVEVTGTFDADAADGPTLTIDTIAIATLD